MFNFQPAGDRRGGGDKAFSGEWSVAVWGEDLFVLVMFGCEKELKRNIWIYQLELYVILCFFNKICLSKIICNLLSCLKCSYDLKTYFGGRVKTENPIHVKSHI